MNAAPHSVQFSERKVAALTQQYHSKVSYDFTRIVYLGLKAETMDIEKTIDLVKEHCDGYEAHRQIRYVAGDVVRISHLCIRFGNGIQASVACDYFRRQEPYVVEIMDNMLTNWYLLEMTSGICPWTLAIMDIVGAASFTKPLSQDTVQNVLRKFGDPRISCYKSGVGKFEQHVQVLFSSMAEALGASIVHGPWYGSSGLESLRFYYRIRIVVSEKEIQLFNVLMSPGTDWSDAFQLEYFVFRKANAVEDKGEMRNDAIQRERPRHVPPKRFHRNWNSRGGMETYRRNSRR